MQVKSNAQDLDQSGFMQSSRDYAEVFNDDFNINGFESQINIGADLEEEQKQSDQF